MMKKKQNACSSVSAETWPPVHFGRSADGFAVARVGDSAFALLPGRSGRFFVAYGSGITRLLSEWRRDDFYGATGDLIDEDEFRAFVLDEAAHLRERKALGRKTMPSRIVTPWGMSQGVTSYDEGIECHTTAEHGGFRLSPERNGMVHPRWRSQGGWYEEDCGWAIVAITFPELFTAQERRHAERTIKDIWPDEWEAIFDVVLGPGESVEKDRRRFHESHASDWIVTAAITSSHHPGMVECVATLGGKRDPGIEERRFLVPKAEYEVGRFGFVINAERHQACDGPSDFVAWGARAASRRAG